MSTLRLTSAAWLAVREHCRRSAPVECVGLIGADQSGVGALVRPLASSANPRQFLADPVDQFAAERELAERGLTIAAIYHSHPSGSPTLSVTDVAFAKAWRCAHLVYALKATAALDQARAYLVSESGAVRELPVILE